MFGGFFGVINNFRMLFSSFWYMEIVVKISSVMLWILWVFFFLDFLYILSRICFALGVVMESFSFIWWEILIGIWWVFLVILAVFRRIFGFVFMYGFFVDLLLLCCIFSLLRFFWYFINVIFCLFSCFRESFVNTVIFFL